MVIIETLFMGMVAGVTVGFPLSSAGCVMVLGHLFGYEMDERLFSAILFGVIAAIAVSFRKDLIRMIASLIGIILDLIRNIKTFFVDRNRRTAYGYQRIMTGNYRRLLGFLLIAMIPTILIGVLIRRFTSFAFGHPLIVAMGFLITALILLVSSFIETPERGPKSLKTTDALLLGIFQGFSFVPGISKIAAGTSAGFLGGLSRRLIVKLSFLMSMFCMLAQALPGALRPEGFTGTSGAPVICLIGGASAFAVAMLVIQMAARMIRRTKIRTFAIGNAAIAAITVLVYLIRK